jgi:hypothetical protein
MRKIHQIIYCLMMAVSLTIGSSLAKSHAAQKWVSANEVVEKLNESIEYVRAHSTIAVAFPAQVPQVKKGKLFASHSSYDSYQQYWDISIATGPQCQTHGCVVGSLSADKKGKLEMDYTPPPFGAPAKSISKQKVKLANKMTGYYTPGHAEADWHPPTMEWQANNVLYTLMWDMKGDDKSTLRTMADSVIVKSAQHQ